MIGQRVESKSTLPLFSLAMLAAGIAMVGAGLVTNKDGLALPGSLLFAMALARLVLLRQKPFAATITEEGIEVEHPPISILYSSIRHIHAGGRSRDPSNFRKGSIALHIAHGGGVLAIPDRLNIPSHELHNFLHGRLATSGEGAVSPTLVEYHDRQVAYFGADQVWVYRADARRTPIGMAQGLKALGLGMILGGMVWMFYGFTATDKQPWAVAGIFLAVFGAFFGLLGFVNNSAPLHGIKAWKKSCLVIGPQGMAMAQGLVEGELRWPEIVDIKFKPRNTSFRLGNEYPLSGIIIKVKGADIVIPDIYDRPLYLINQRIMVCSGRLRPVDLEEL